MCGIAGSYTGKPFQDSTSFEKVMSTLAHRGPDDSGVWYDRTHGLSLGHTRLSILDLSVSGHQPMHSSCGRYVIVFNGEIYNHLQLRQRLNSEVGAKWVGSSDTETLLSAISFWGIEKALQELIGMFAFGLWDKTEKALFLARDRLGEKPLYFGWQGETFLFASELKAIKAHNSFKNEIDRQALALFLRHNYVPSPFSIYKGIKKLLPGSWVRIEAEGQIGVQDLDVKTYWSLSDIALENRYANFAISDESALKQLEKKLASTVESQMLADVPLGALLSGGVDSSLIVALMQSQKNVPIDTFTIGFDNDVYNEASHASEIANHLGTHHTELVLSPRKALDLIPSLPSVYDEPFADSSQLPTMLVMQLAKQHVTVALSGDGGDEVFGGYNRYLYAPTVWKKFSILPPVVRNRVLTAMASISAEKANNFSKYLGVAQAGDKMHKMAQKFSRVNTLDELFMSLISEWEDVSSIVIGELTVPDIRHSENWPRLENSIANMMVFDSRTYLPDDILVKVDRAAMAVSLETRAPYLDKNLIEFSWSLPFNMKIRNGRGKWILRQLLNDYVPEELANRPKMGFSIPLDDWLRGPLKDWAANLLDRRRLVEEGYLKPERIVQAWQEHQSGRANFGYRLWSVLMFQAWLEKE